MINLKNGIVLGVAVLMEMIWAGYYTVPVTGRKSLDLVDDADVRRLSLEAFEQTKKQYPISIMRGKGLINWKRFSRILNCSLI